ncbi:MAG: hypothetical protein AB2L14_32940 [Candidatus Xenobiia bacterium LiM19]
MLIKAQNIDAFKSVAQKEAYCYALQAREANIETAEGLEDCLMPGLYGPNPEMHIENGNNAKQASRHHDALSASTGTTVKKKIDKEDIFFPECSLEQLETMKKSVQKKLFWSKLITNPVSKTISTLGHTAGALAFLGAGSLLGAGGMMLSFSCYGALDCYFGGNTEKWKELDKAYDYYINKKMPQAETNNVR